MGIIDYAGVIRKCANDVNGIGYEEGSGEPVFSEVNCCWGIRFILLEFEGFLEAICTVDDICCILDRDDGESS